MEKPATAGKMNARKRTRKLLDIAAMDPEDCGLPEKKQNAKRKRAAKEESTAVADTDQDNDGAVSETVGEKSKRETQSKGKDEVTWMSFYNKLVEYKKQHGNCEVPQRYKQDPAFGSWVKNQREYYKSYTKNKKSSLTEERVAMLNNIDFAWVSTKTKRTVMKDFNVHLAELQQYKERHGHTRVPHVYDDNPGLGVFCHRVKIYYREMQEGKRKSPNDWLTQERIDALNALCFEWKVGRWKNALTWEERYAQLVEFKDTFGHCNVTKEYDTQNAPGLKAWVSNQRTYLKRPREKRIKRAAALSEEKIASLKSLGVEFERGQNESADETGTGGVGF